MGMIERMAAKAMIATVRKSLPGASDEKLVKHYNKLQKAYRMTDDVHSQADDETR